MLNEQYWSYRYQNQQDGWDIGYPAPALTALIDQLTDKNTKILIPGCGNAYEAAYAYENGYKNTFIIDWALKPLQAFQNKHPHFPANQIIHADFFKHEGQYEVIIEQTFFCALDPLMRSDYVKKCSSLLVVKGHLQGLLFNCTFEKAGPPFGGNKNEYMTLFEPYFDILTMENCSNSIPPRSGNELIFDLVKK